MLSTQGKKARCHCDQLNKRKYSACPHPPSLILLPFPFTHGLCAVTWLWAVLKLWGRGWDFKERSGVGVYITVAIKGSHEIRALVMIGFVFRLVCCGVLFFFKKGGGGDDKQIISQRLYNPNGLEFGKPASSHMGNQCLDFELTEGSKMKTATLTSCPLVQHWYCTCLLHLGWLLKLVLLCRRVKQWVLFFVFSYTVFYSRETRSLHVDVVYFYILK